jgi:hypothetical protein
MSLLTLLPRELREELACFSRYAGVVFITRVLRYDPSSETMRKLKNEVAHAPIGSKNRARAVQLFEQRFGGL